MDLYEKAGSTNFVEPAFCIQSAEHDEYTIGIFTIVYLLWQAIDSCCLPIVI